MRTITEKRSLPMDLVLTVGTVSKLASEDLRVLGSLEGKKSEILSRQKVLGVLKTD